MKIKKVRLKTEIKERCRYIVLNVKEVKKLKELRELKEVKKGKEMKGKLLFFVCI